MSTITALRKLDVAKSMDVRKLIPDIQFNFDLLSRVGTWTPVILGSTSQTGQVYTTQDGIWYRSGRMVISSFIVQLSTLGTITGSVQIGGLNTAPDDNVSFMLSNWENLTTAVICIPARIAAGAQVATLDKVTAATTSSQAAQLAQGDLAATTLLAGSLVYRVK